MSIHIDIVRNDWLAGEQHPIARLYIAQGGLQIDSPDPARWTPMVERALASLDLGDDPEAALAKIPQLLHGSALLAVGPHDESACDYRGWAPVRIESVSREREPATR